MQTHVNSSPGMPTYSEGKNFKDNHRFHNFQINAWVLINMCIHQSDELYIFLVPYHMTFVPQIRRSYTLYVFCEV